MKGHVSPAVERSTRFTATEIVLLISIVAILLLIAVPLYGGSRARAHVAEARFFASEWKSLVWACLTNNRFWEAKCDSPDEIRWTPPPNSEAWLWQSIVFFCDNGMHPVVLPNVTTSTCNGPDEGQHLGDNAYVGIRVQRHIGVRGLRNDYVLIVRSNTGRVQESPADGSAIPAGY